MNSREKLNLWQDRLYNSLSAYSSDLSDMDRREALYCGTHTIYSAVGAKNASCVRNIVSELIEAEAETTIPRPKVTARRKADEKKAELVEAFLINELDRLPFETINDMDERTTPIQGGDFFLIEWDITKGGHSSDGELTVTLLHPKQVIPQCGVTDIKEMDYIIIQTAKTKAFIKRMFGVSVDKEYEENPDVRSTGDYAFSEDIVTLNTAYYRNTDGKIGRFRWVNDVVVEDIENYQSRQLRYCDNCGAVCYEDECDCGCRSFTVKAEKSEILASDVVCSDGSVIKKGTKIPFYSPDVMPIVLRKNVSVFGKLLGDSDVDKITDQQELIKKLGSKIQEKLLKGGSYVTFPRGASIRKTDEELKVIELNNISDKQLIDVLNIQPDISRDMEYQERVYEAARQTVGITDSYQGRYDPTATSGKAKQIAAEQSAGRLEGKRVMKRAAYAEVFEIMFRFLLAYADTGVTVKAGQTETGNEYRTFNRYDFLEMDDAGEYYWNDEFLFSVDSSTLPAGNRELMWKEAKENFSNGAYGNPSEDSARLLYWTELERLHYPHAKEVRDSIIKNAEQAKNENQTREE